MESSRGSSISPGGPTPGEPPDVEMFRLMKKAGCFMLSIGGESGNAGILKAINKGTKPQDIKETVRILRKVGITSLVYFLIGLPGETRERPRRNGQICQGNQPGLRGVLSRNTLPGDAIS